MRRGLSDQEFHALYCPVKNTKSALFLVACFSVAAFVSWKGLHKVPEQPSVVELLFAILVVAMLAKWLVAFTCFRERLVFGVVVVSFVIPKLCTQFDLWLLRVSFGSPGFCLSSRLMIPA